MLDDGDGVEQRIAPVARAIGADVVRMLAYFGRVVNLAARISAHAGADHVLVSAEVVAAVPDRIRFVDAGDVDLKGFAQPVRIYEAASR